LPTPTALKLLQGNPGKRALDLSAGVNPQVAIPSAPGHLSPAAKKEWKRITPLLEELGLISGLDRQALALYCQTAGRLDELETAFNGMVNRLVTGSPAKNKTSLSDVAIEGDPQGSPSGSKAKAMAYADAVYAASHAVTPSGYAQQSVIIQLIKSHREQVNRYLMHFGLSPAARGRVQPSNYVQPTLPGVDEPPSAASGFGKFAVVGR
jgi:P27 family predicted phage terminase small subunit